MKVGGAGAVKAGGGGEGRAALTVDGFAAGPGHAVGPVEVRAATAKLAVGKRQVDKLVDMWLRTSVWWLRNLLPHPSVLPAWHWYASAGWTACFEPLGGGTPFRRGGEVGAWTRSVWVTTVGASQYPLGDPEPKRNRHSLGEWRLHPAAKEIRRHLAEQALPVTTSEYV